MTSYYKAAKELRLDFKEFISNPINKGEYDIDTYYFDKCIDKEISKSKLIEIIQGFAKKGYILFYKEENKFEIIAENQEKKEPEENNFVKQLDQELNNIQNAQTIEEK